MVATVGINPVGATPGQATQAGSWDFGTILDRTLNTATGVFGQYLDYQTGKLQTQWEQDRLRQQQNFEIARAVNGAGLSTGSGSTVAGMSGSLSPIVWIGLALAAVGIVVAVRR